MFPLTQDDFQCILILLQVSICKYLLVKASVKEANHVKNPGDCGHCIVGFPPERFAALAFWLARVQKAALVERLFLFLN